MRNLRRLVLSSLFVGMCGTATAGTFPLPPMPVDAVRAGGAPVILAQAGDTALRLGQLEEYNRALNGRIEELTFQLLQMQEQMRQMQQDNEFRFQQLEKGTPNDGKRSDAGPAVTVPDPQRADNGLPGVEDSVTSSTGQRGEPAKDLGQIVFDNKGNLVAPGTETASLDTPEGLYKAGYGHILAGDYSLAEQVFRDYIDIYPDGPEAADAMFWLGEAQYSQSRFDESAKTFLDAHKRYPKAEKGPDTLLKLGMSLAALNNRDTACATYREVLVRYPGASAMVRGRVAEEQARMSC